MTMILIWIKNIADFVAFVGFFNYRHQHAVGFVLL